MTEQGYVTERIVPISEFADAMRESDAVFAERVTAFAELFGNVSHDMLGVLAQSSYICWFECEFEVDLIATCRAIGTGKPTHLYICSQISPKRWDFLNEYVVAIQTWFGADAAFPSGVRAARVQQLVGWLGKRNNEREAVAALFLSHLVELLTQRVSLSRLGSSDIVPERMYHDYSNWYSCQTTSDAATRARCILGTDGDQLLSGMKLPSEPACQYRWPRYLDIKVCSIGALKWRGALPPDSAPKAPKQEFWAEVADAIQMWLNGRQPGSETSSQLHDALGKRSDSKASIVQEFLNKPPPGTGFYDWMIERSVSEGLIPSEAFARREH